MPYLFRDERHHRVDELEELVEEAHGCLIGITVYRFAESGLNKLKVPAAIVVPEELIDCHEGV